MCSAKENTEVHIPNILFPLVIMAISNTIK